MKNLKKHYFDKERFGYVLEDSVIRDKFSKIHHGADLPFNEEGIKKLEDIGIKFVEDASNYKKWFGNYDCQDYAFKKLNLWKYSTNRKGIRINDIFEKDFKDLEWIPNPEEGSLAIYYEKLGNKFSSSHFGIVRDIEGSVKIHSKFQDDHIYEHDVSSVRKVDGKYVAFFRKK